MPGNVWDKALKSMELGSETSTLRSLIEIAGDDRVLIENHKGVTCYSNSLVCVKTTFGIVSITGNEMVMACMSKHKLVISGVISEVSLCRGNAK